MSRCVETKKSSAVPDGYVLVKLPASAPAPDVRHEPERPVLPSRVCDASVAPVASSGDAKSSVPPPPSPSSVSDVCALLVEECKATLRASRSVGGAAALKRITLAQDTTAFGVNISSDTYKYNFTGNIGLDVGSIPAFGASGATALETRLGDFVYIKEIDYTINLTCWYQNTTDGGTVIPKSAPTYRIVLFEDKMPLLNNWKAASPYFSEGAGYAPWTLTGAVGDPDDPSTDNINLIFSYASANMAGIPRSTFMHARARETDQRFRVLQDHHFTVEPKTYARLSTTNAGTAEITKTFRIKHSFPGRGHRIQFADNTIVPAVSAYSAVNSAIYISVTSDADFTGQTSEWDNQCAINGVTYFSDLSATD
jgi:hypothetical protein